ncbi:Hypothetical predicted protein [Mytilus galloprovincialis]|uniref:Reverse transcriptase domain-containing protein n=1 Tax=Mytilus galloprovincialis TaxID=29158 RepID=A0A8B6CUC6_MYTGA|nr:Hypothetical predicted protein [Mytilus galloprovincialis]
MAIVLQLAPFNTTLNIKIMAIVLQLVPSNTTLTIQIYILRATHTTLTMPEITIFHLPILIVYHLISGAMVGLTTTSRLIVVIPVIHTLTIGIIIKTRATRFTHVTIRKQELQIIIPMVTGGAMVGLTTTSPQKPFIILIIGILQKINFAFLIQSHLLRLNFLPILLIMQRQIVEKKTSTVKFHNSTTYSTGTTNHTPKEKDESKFYGNDSSMYTRDDKASPMLHVSRIGQPLYYSQDQRIQERQKIIDAGYNDPALLYSLIKKQRGKLSRFIEELTVDEEIFQSPIDFTEQSILLLNNLYENASSLIKWNNIISKEMFTIDPGVRKGGAFSADLYKIYINPLLNSLSTPGLGGRVGNINCCAPTCADDVALVSNNPLELQTMINIALDFSKREGYLLQPTKSVVIPVKTCRKFYKIEDESWKLNGKNMSIVLNASHIGIQKSYKDSSDSTVNEI